MQLFIFFICLFNSISCIHLRMFFHRSISSHLGIILPLKSRIEKKLIETRLDTDCRTPRFNFFFCKRIFFWNCFLVSKTENINFAPFTIRGLQKNSCQLYIEKLLFPPWLVFIISSYKFLKGFFSLLQNFSKKKLTIQLFISSPKNNHMKSPKCN